MFGTNPKKYLDLSADEIRLRLDRVESAIHETLGFRLRENQRQAAVAMLSRCVVELATGEGKTVSVAAAIALYAGTGQKVLISTANDYLASRDAEWMKPVYEKLNLSCAAIVGNMAEADRRAAYDCNVTYGTIREFGFDFLRDCILERSASNAVPVQPTPGILIVDEADSLLIDEARTPLLISGPAAAVNSAVEACYRWCGEVVPQFQHERDYIRMEHSQQTAFTLAGRSIINRLRMPEVMAPLAMTDIVHALERAIFVNDQFRRDEHYLVEDGKVLIVDEFTGRVSKGRTWSGGIHQAVEANEGLTLTRPTETKAQITVQDYVSRFPHLCGMTGTGYEAAEEFKSLYELEVKKIEPHVPSQRMKWEDRVFSSCLHKWAAIAEETRQLVQCGRSVLIGTRTVRQSQELYLQLEQEGLGPVVLNAANHREEAEIIVRAGHSGSVTVATNMAGRGTDIKLDEVCQNAGGLHVIGSELHAAARIDRQLQGRSARCGDPGSFRQFMSLDDQILTLAYTKEEGEKIKARFSGKSSRRQIALLRKAQQAVTKRHAGDRLELASRTEHVNGLYESLGMNPILDRFLSSGET